MRKYIMSLLGKFCDLDEVVDGFVALEELKKHAYDIVLSDVMMPRVSGGELLDAIRADPALKNMPFIMLSARAGEEARLEGLARGADGTLSHARVTTRDGSETPYRLPRKAFQRQGIVAAHAYATANCSPSI